MTSTSELATGEHIFKITSYSVLKEFGVDNYVCSSTFTIGGHEFYIKMYPGGDEKEAEEFISIYLVLNNVDKELLVQYDFCLVDISGDSVVVGPRSYVASPNTFTPKNPAWGFGCFIKRVDLEASQYLKDDCFMVRCRVWFLKARQSVGPSDNLHQHLAKLLESGEMADVTFEVEEESFNAHRIVLAARSPVFKQLLGQNGESDTRSRVRIEDVKPPVFKALLRYVYTEELPSDGDEGDADKGLTNLDQQMLVAADKYAIQMLKFIYEENLCNKVSLNTVASTFELAEKYNCNRLKAACLEFAAQPETLIALMQTHAKISEGSEQQNTISLTGLPDLLNKLSGAFISN
ncbi:BTB/POZ and MATH domain-containing protein 2 [Rhynchospora pubera]|uniref:BTB/POZ and MATH domain-containing protein 2 n=1 Tax=Rhynchospora pubera TaxID=906938 RepID=A0AAV8CZE1_9POAL|nr:BTB/POZ and MATH domain-containing protein 2 [Rhynchospora pubera]